MVAQRIAEFDIWRPGYGGAVVYAYLPGTSTLAVLYEDENMTVPAANPQTLSSKSAPGGYNYGKFAQPVYVDTSYYLNIEGVEDTGIIRPPILSLQEQDVSESTVLVNGSSFPISLKNLSSVVVYVAAFGPFVSGSGGVADDNTETLQIAISALSHGGQVILPAGTYKINALEIPEGVIIRGQGREATILESVIGDISFNIVGDRAGFADLTLDGVSLSTSSVAIRSVGNDEITFSSVMIRRFETGLHCPGGKGHIYTDFSIENTQNGAKLHGDTDTGTGKSFSDLVWSGGLISVSSTKGLSLSYEDATCHNILLDGVGFEDNLALALEINGSQNLSFQSCWFTGNVDNVLIQDDDAPLTPETSYQNDVFNVRFLGGRMSGGTFEATDTCQNVVLQDVKLEDVEFVMTTPTGFLILQDCFEDDGVTITGEATKLLRSTTSNDGASFGVTTSNTATKAWSIELDPGQIAYLVAKVIGKGRNVAQRGIYHVGCGAYRPGSTLAYDTQTANFTAGAILTGQSSGAKARIQADSDSGTTGTLTLTDIQGEFIDNEIITDDASGSATANGTLSHQNVSLDSTGNINIRAVYETNSNWAVAFAANGPEVELRVTGDTSQTVEWSVEVEVVTT